MSVRSPSSSPDQDPLLLSGVASVVLNATTETKLHRMSHFPYNLISQPILS